MSKLNDEIKELNLLLLYLSGWEEESRNEPGKMLYRAWKGYLFDVLNELAEEELIIQNMKYKSVLLTDKGIERAKEVKEKYL